MSLKSLKDHQARKNSNKKQVKVGFTKWQYQTVHAFLEELRDSGQVEKDLGAPIKVEVNWADASGAEKAHIYFEGSRAHKIIMIKDILEAASGN